ncbi:gephyrin-like molybdotransferase receptor GlpR [Streptomyces sp. NPDC048639]|uniref:divisome protein SepX/GlpR n=1 Tax=Streptomyces sp. NPDC048639 TaxID=3365581 RepID=UPI00371CABCA
MSSSGLIYAVIVGAWAAYLVPMWLRRQDELNEARPTERFSTAIRLLAGRAGMERRYAKDLEKRSSADGDDEEPERSAADPDAETGSVDVRSFAVSASTETLLRATIPEDAPPHRPDEAAHRRDEADHRRDEAAHRRDEADHRREEADHRREEATHRREEASHRRDETAHRRDEAARERAERPAHRPAAQRPALSAAQRARRSKAIARRRRTTMVLFLAFTLGSVVAAVGGLAFLWAPAVPAVLLSLYIGHLRIQERRRFAFTMDQRRAEAAAQRLRERRPRPSARPEPRAEDTSRDVGRASLPDAPPADDPAPASPHAAGRRALVEQTDHAEWVDQQRRRGAAEGDSWDPVPVPLPTYVTAPVAPRATGSVDLDAPDAWSSARSSTLGPASESAPAEAEPAVRRPVGRRARERGRTPLFDQYAPPSSGAPEAGDVDRPRAANE